MSYQDQDYTDSLTRDFATMLDYSLLAVKDPQRWENFGFDFNFTSLENYYDMVNVLYLMPDLFDMYFYESYQLDDWWYGAYTEATQRTDEENWWNEVQWYDQILRDDGTKDKI